ncbi:hypothetical protein B0H14DRAFT_3534941 [Mycena olivaceomarginata]|nr:hypothetical protein B0H14DRAFT_3534941 [Mycena olivaceomarginata]
MCRGAMWLPRIHYPDSCSNVLRFYAPEVIFTPEDVAKIFNVEWSSIDRMFGVPTSAMPGLLTRNVRGAVEIPPGDIRLGGDFVLPRSDAVFDHGPDLPPEARLGVQPQRTYAGEIFIPHHCGGLQPDRNQHGPYTGLLPSLA